ncbi:diaminopimelate epimerase [soil metagenome]
MELTFFKYQGAGNDFVMVDNRSGIFKGTEHGTFEQLCHRRFGIGADGLILLQEKDGFDFEMKYYNADGKESTMCGNGGRCVVMFAKQLGIMGTQGKFWAIDGAHEAEILADGSVSLQMGDVLEIQNDGSAYVLNTGSPHYVQQVPEINEVDVFEKGKAVRYNPTYKAEGINVNFLQIADGKLKARTYERGVEDETYACGTGVTASAIVASLILENSVGNYAYSVETLGGRLEVSYHWNGKGANNVWLTGEAKLVFEGCIELP